MALRPEWDEWLSVQSLYLLSGQHSSLWLALGDAERKALRVTGTGRVGRAAVWTSLWCFLSGVLRISPPHQLPPSTLGLRSQCGVQEDDPFSVCSFLPGLNRCPNTGWTHSQAKNFSGNFSIFYCDIYTYIYTAHFYVSNNLFFFFFS